MTAFKDQWGNPVTADTREAVEALDGTVMAYLAMRVDIGDRLKEAFAADPEMPMALVTKVAFLKMFATAAMEEAANKTLTKAQDVFGKRDVSEREEAHLSAVSAWVRGEMEEACLRWEAILVDHPRDVFALKLSQLNRFYLGIGKDMRDAIGRAWYAWDQQVPGYGFMAGSYAFALEEAGDYARAEPLGREAVDIDPADVWAAHAVAHVLEMQGRSAEGLTWLDGLRTHWGDIHNFVHHAHWHRALFALDSGDSERALAIFDQDVWTDRVEDYLDLSNGAALLWRLRERGVPVEDRTGSVADLAEQKMADHGLIFSDCHIALALAQDGRPEPLSAFLDDMAEVAQGQGTQARVAKSVGQTLCRAAAADAQGEADVAIDLLLSARPQLYRIGGSHAQRDLFERMLIANTIKAGRGNLAKALISERLEARPGDTWGRAVSS